MFVFQLTTRENSVRFERNAGNNKVEADRIIFIKSIREAFSCDFKSAKDFCDLMLAEMNKLTPDANHLRARVLDEINKIHNANDMQDILRFVRTVIDHPQMGTFDHDGNYTPRAL